MADPFEKGGGPISSRQVFWRLIRQARLARVLAVYFSASFVILQVVDLFTNQLGLPDWVFPGTLVLLLIGLPLVVATALVQSVGRRDDGEAPLTDVPPGSALAVGGAMGFRRWLTWRRTLLGGALAFVLLGASVSGYMGMRLLGIGPFGTLVAAGVLDDRARVVLADFDNRSSDPTLGGAVTEAFRVDLAQSPLITVVEPALIQDALIRMDRAGETALDVALAREVAVREGIDAVLTGEVAALGAGYVLSARLVAAESGEVLTAHRETAADSNAIIPALDRLSKRIRERIGESLTSIRRNEPLERVSTASLEALRRYSLAVHALDREGDYLKGLALLEDAVALDTAFAMAYRKLGVAYLNLGVFPEESRAALTRAFEHRERLTDRERYLLLGTYYRFVTGEREAAMTAYRALLARYPDDPAALNNLATQYIDLRSYERAEELFRRTMQDGPPTALAYMNLADVQTRLSRFGDAERTIDAFFRAYPGHPSALEAAALLATAQRRYGEAEQLLLRLREEHRSQDWFSRASSRLANSAVLQGRLAEGDRYLDEMYTAATEVGIPAITTSVPLQRALIEVLARGRPSRALAEVERMLRDHPFESMHPINRPHLALGAVYAEAGDPLSARRYLEAYEREADEGTRRLAEPFVWMVRGAIAHAENRPHAAIDDFRQADRSGCRTCALPQLGRAYEAAGQPDSAIAVYERYLTYPEAGSDAPWLPLVLERLGALYEARGDTAGAQRHYTSFVELWEGADAELQPRVAAARQRLAALRSGPVSAP